MRKICVLTANRADFSRIETILRAIKEHPDLESQLVVLGSHLLDKTGKTIDEIKKKGFAVDYELYSTIEGSNLVTMAKSVGYTIAELASVIQKIKPDIVIAPVDRFESLAMGITPALMNIHVAHIQGGEVTGTIDESIRHALTKMSHLHFVATEESRRRVIKMGELEETVFNTGCPGTDLLLQMPKMDNRETIKKLNEIAVEKADPNTPFFFVVQHPVTTEYSSAKDQMIEIIGALNNFSEQIIFLWPNIDAGSDEISKVLRKFREENKTKRTIRIFKHIPSEIFANILRNTICQIGNSSSGIRESCYFGTPVVNIGSRQNSRERGKNVVDAPCECKAITGAINKQIFHGKYAPEYIYGDGTAGKKIAEILATVKLPNIQKKITY